MTYVSKKEKVFDLPEQEDVSLISLKNTDTRLKRFPSVSDRRAWTTEEQQRYQHLYGLVNGSETNIAKSSSSFKYIPFDVLLGILMAEKDAYIQELLERQDRDSCSGGKADVLYKAEGFDDSDDDRDALIRKDAEMVALKNKIAGLESELEDYRDTLTKAMHKLENMDAIMCENSLLREKIKCSEETIKCLEEQKQNIENEVWSAKRFSESESEIVDKNGRWSKSENWERGDWEEELSRLASERDILKSQVDELQKELENARTNAAEMEVLRKISETTSNSLEEITKENKCYKKKLETMKCLEKHVEDLKMQAQTLTDKYKRESQKANDQLKQINVTAKEVQALREERDRLQKRIEELVPYESQYISLQSKLHQVEIILEENELLNKKLIQLDKLELENEHLKMKIEHLQDAEMQAVADKEKILQLQCEVVEQEEEIRRMLRQIEELSEGYTDKNEVYNLRKELDEKNGKLKQFERQVIEIPILESEIEELKNKLQKCIDDFKTDKDLLKRLQEELEACRNRCQELEEMALPYPSANSYTEENPKNSYTSPELVNFDTGMNERKIENNIPMQDAECQSAVKEYVDDYVQVKVQGECGGCGFEPFEDLQQLKERNETLKTEVEILRSKLSEINLDDFLQQTNKMKELLRVKEERIIHLESEITRLKDELRHFDVMEIEKLKENREEMEHEIKNLSEINGKLMVEIEMRQAIVNRGRELEIVLMVERKARAFAMNLVADLERELAEEKRKREIESALSKLQKEEANMAKRGIYQNLSSEINGLKVFKKLSEKVIHELKAENEILRELKDHSEKIEITALKNLTKKLRAKVKALKSLSKPEIQSEYESVQEKVKMLLKETDTLVSEINNLKAALDSEKKTKDYLEKELIGLQAEIAACLTAGSRVFDKELAARDVLVLELKRELTKVRDDLEGALKEARILRVENAKLSDSCTDLKAEKKILKNEIEQLMVQIEEQKNLESDIDRLSEQIEKQKKMENELDKFTASLSRREEVEKDERWCKIEEHKNWEEEIRRLSALRESLERQVIDNENKEREFLSEIILLKNNVVELKSIISKFEAAEDGLKKNLTRKDEELNEVMEANLYLKKEIEKRDLKEELWRRTGEKLEETHLNLRKKIEVEESRALSAALDEIEHELEKFKGKFSECQRMEDEMADLRLKRDSIIDKMVFFEVEMKQVKEKLNEFEKFNLESEETEAEKKISDLASLAELEEKRKEIEILKLENENLHNELSKAENVLEVSRKLHKTASQMQTLPPSAEFFTPPALPSPRSSDNLESERETDEMMSVETHRKMVTDLENRFRREIQKLKEANWKKVKKLSGNHEKDTRSRMKTFYENINNIKSNYENGIRKLVEKHKLSIGKLQELHEEEIEELHKNYETQMLAMEKQNDDLVNELKAKSAEKSKKMTEDHNRELDQIQTRYENILKEKEAQVERFSRGTSEKDEAHKATLDNLTQFYQSTILELEEKHNKELKNCKKNHIKKIEIMKNKYEDLLVEERKKYEEQLEEMLHRLKKAGQQRAGTNEEVINRNFMERRSLPANPRLEFLEVLQKIINEGLESLTFEELILVHSATCFVPETMNDHEERGGGELNESSADGGCKHRQLMAAEKEELLKRIFTLEREIVIKQLETHEAIVNMEAAEKFRIQELKNALCNAQQKNMELKKHLSNQSKFEMDMKIEKYMMDRQASLNETNVMEKVKELEREKAERKRIEEELQRERANVKNLTAVLESEKERFRSQRKRDSDYVESIRLRLEEALNHEQMMESQLDNEARFRAKLESELQSLQKSFNLIADGAPMTLVDSKTVKDFKNFDQCENAKKVSKHNRSRSRQKSPGKALHNF